MQAQKHWLQLMFESVASMDAADKDLASHSIGVRPVIAFASGLSQVKRKRFPWATWRMSEWIGFALSEQDKAWSMTFEVTSAF